MKANEQGVEVFSGPFRLGIAANHEFLLFVELNFDPCSGSFPGFVSGIGALTDHTFESQSADPDKSSSIFFVNETEFRITPVGFYSKAPALPSALRSVNLEGLCR